ncbi:MAG: rubrerythrin [Oscillospiraceae bacterium]|nr:rubrerythrin [Oscillospiraceae bacterium]MBQ9721704.1 rubrerythrin [Oscillospiraceae bacterium]
MIDEKTKALLKSQQGELDAVLMYQRLAEVVTDERDAKVFRALANEEWRHAQVFYAHTHAMLHPKKAKAVLLPRLYRLLGRGRVYPMIAKGEYDAAAKYERLIADFPEVARVRDDETRHGDLVASLLKR